MTLSQDQLRSFSAAAEPLIKWLVDNCHPHCVATVDVTGAVLREDLARVRSELSPDAYVEPKNVVVLPSK